jgi:hypothetical protein
MSTTREAVARTFNMAAEQHAPERELIGRGVAASMPLLAPGSVRPSQRCGMVARNRAGPVAGTFPFITTGLVASFESSYVPVAVLMMFLAAVTLAALLAAPRQPSKAIEHRLPQRQRS